jgi:hypothetical protein
VAGEGRGEINRHPYRPVSHARVRWIFRKELRNPKVEIHVVTINPFRYRISDWWQHEEGLIAFQNEVIKSLYYWFKY